MIQDRVVLATSRSGMRGGLVSAFATAMICASAGGALAHALAPSLLELVELGDRAFEVTWRQSNVTAPGAPDRRPVLPENCAALTPTRVSQDRTSITAVWTVDCGVAGIVGQRVAVVGLGESQTDALLRVQFLDGRRVRRVLSARAPYMDIPQRESRVKVGCSYARLGIDHILGGLDHLLFVFGLLLLARDTRALVVTVTSFTVGHSLTLSLAVLGVAKVSQGPVEVLIALSILILAVELAGAAEARVSLLGRRPWAIAGAFGLLHGLGFAAALREVGLPQHEIPLSLLSFNVGIEIGQLAFVCTVLAARRLLMPVTRALPPWTSQAPVYAMGSLAAMWMIERTVALLG